MIYKRRNLEWWLRLEPLVLDKSGSAIDFDLTTGFPSVKILIYNV